MAIDVDTLVGNRVRAELRSAAAAKLLEAANAEMQAAADELKATHTEINAALTAEIKRLVDEAA